MLAELQQQLSDIYRVGQHYDVRDYVITDRTLAKYLGQDAILTNTDETLLVSQDDEGLALSLFLDRDMLERVESTNPLACLQAESLDDLWKVLEGISHFNYVVWKAEQDRTVTLLELELQGEVDKFVSTMLLAVEQADAGLLNGMHSWLFDNVRFDDGLDEEQLRRYQSANDYAGRYCQRLRQQLIHNDSLVLAELRQFYRLQMPEKISYIHTQAWAA